MIPGLDETLRINGEARLSTDQAVCEQVMIGGKAPKVAALVEVREAYIHCAKALRRGAVWHPADWPDRSTMPTVACMLRDHTGLAVEASVIEASIEHGLRTDPVGARRGQLIGSVQIRAAHRSADPPDGQVLRATCEPRARC